MIYIIELGLLAYVLVDVIAIVRSGALDTLIRFGVFLVAIVVGGVGFAIGGAVAPSVSGNLFARMGVAFVGAMIGFLIAKHTLLYAVRASKWKKEEERKNRARKGKESRPPLLSKAADRWLTAGIVCVYLLGYALMTDFLVNLVGVIPEARREIREHSLFLHAFLPRDGAQAEEKPSFGRRLLRVPGSVYGVARNAVHRATGLDEVNEQVAALHEVAALPPSDRRWLVETTPDLKRLVDNAAVRRAVADPKVRKLIKQFQDGDKRAFYRLGEQPSIVALYEDKDVRKAIERIDIEKLRRKARERRKVLAPAP